LVYIAKGQLNVDEFLKEFAKADSKTKVNLVASKNQKEISKVFPFIKDTLDKIRQQAYGLPKTHKTRFLFDKIYSSIAADHKNYADAIFILENSLRNNALDIHDSLTCLIALKTLFVKIKNYNRAIDLDHLIELNRHRKSDEVDIDFGISKGHIYLEMGLMDKAIFEREHEYKKNKHTYDTLATVNYYNDIGVFLNSAKKFDSAKVWFLKAKNLFEQLSYPNSKKTDMDFFKGLINGNLGSVYSAIGDFKKATPLLQNDIYYSLKSFNFESALNSYVTLIETHLKLKDAKLAKRYLDSANVLVVENLKDTKSQLKYMLVKANYYTAINDLSNANQCYQNYLELNAKQVALENEQQIKNENISINVEQKELDLIAQDNANKRAELQEAKQKSFQAYLITGVLILILIIAFLIVNNYYAKKRGEQLALKNQQIGTQKLQIEQSLKEKDLLIKEIHHRVKNNLQIITSMLSLQIGKIEDEKTSSILRDAKQRINSIALTHQMLYQKDNISSVNLSDYVERLSRQVEFLMPVSNIELVTNIGATNNRLTIDNAVPLGLLVNELLTNAYKHAFPDGIKGQIEVSLVENDESFTLKVTDNGVGLPDDFDTTERKTLGMELVHILAEQLDSIIVIDKTNGSSFALEIKKTQ
jgi:two-component sensor histidine kinase/Tfp pilus assembly protein PilF